MREKIDPTNLSFASPGSGEDFIFDSDNVGINGWFARSSRSEHNLFNCRVRHAYLAGVGGIVGFYSLKLLLEPKSDFTGSNLASLLLYSDKITTVHLQWFAVRSGFERRKIGTYMMGQVLEDAYHVMTRVGAHALTVKYMGLDSEQLYRKAGLVDYGGTGSKKLFIPAQNVIDFIEI